MRKSKVAEEIRLIAEISVAFPTFLWVALSPLWWHVEPIKVLVGYLLTVVGTVALCAVISVRDELEQEKRRG